MASPILLCTDGSDAALGALSAGVQLLGNDHEMILVTVMDAPDEGALAGSGHAGPELSLEEFDDQVAEAGEAANAAIGAAERARTDERRDPHPRWRARCSDL